MTGLYVSVIGGGGGGGGGGDGTPGGTVLPGGLGGGEGHLGGSAATTRNVSISLTPSGTLAATASFVSSPSTSLITTQPPDGEGAGAGGPAGIGGLGTGSAGAVIISVTAGG